MPNSNQPWEMDKPEFSSTISVTATIFSPFLEWRALVLIFTPRNASEKFSPHVYSKF